MLTGMPANMSERDTGNSDQWREVALRLRRALHELGADVEECGPGETEPCGHSWWQHSLSYAAAAQAFSEHTVRHLCHDDPDVRGAADELLDYWRDETARVSEH